MSTVRACEFDADVRWSYVPQMAELQNTFAAHLAALSGTNVRVTPSAGDHIEGLLIVHQDFIVIGAHAIVLSHIVSVMQIQTPGRTGLPQKFTP